MKHLILPCLTLLLLTFLHHGACAESFTGKCIRVLEGDIIAVSHNGKEHIIRIDCIDCPEPDQDSGDRALQFTTALLLDQEVWIDVRRPDKSRRLMSRIKIGDRDAALEITRAGWAWYLDKFYKDRDIACAETEAKGRKIGLWASENPVAPWEFRQRKYAAMNSYSIGNALLEKEVVCINEHDPCYHRPECESVKKTSSFTMKSSAKKSGLMACPTCRPDHMFKQQKTHDYGFFEAHNPKQGVARVGAYYDATDIVYTTSTGMSYHRADCGYLKYSSHAIPRSRAKDEGYQPCRVCNP